MASFIVLFALFIFVEAGLIPRPFMLPPDLAFVGIVAAVVAITFIGMWVLTRRRLWPAVQITHWLDADTAASWAELDGGEAPESVEAALVRVHGRRDDRAVALRLAWLNSARRVDELRDELARWDPADRESMARRAMFAADLRYLESDDSDLAEAWSATARVSDPLQRTGLEVRLLYRQAIRLADADLDPFPPLIDARRRLGAEGDSLGHEAWVTWRAAYVRALGLSLGSVVVLGLLGVALNVGLLLLALPIVAVVAPRFGRTVGEWIPSFFHPRRSRPREPQEPPQ